MARSDPLKLPNEARPRGVGLAPLGEVPLASSKLQPVFGARPRRLAFGGPLPVVAAVVVLGIVAVLVSGNRGERLAEPPSRDPELIARGAIEPLGTGSREEAPRSSEPEPIALADPGAEAERPPPPVSADAGTGRPGDAARTLIATLREGGAEEDLDTVFRKAGEAMKKDRRADAHLLYFFAARRGHAPAAFVLADLYDPLHFDKDRSLLGRPDPVQALKWYRIAADQGDTEAQARLASLVSWVDDKARAGDAEAERLRLSWR